MSTPYLGRQITLGRLIQENGAFTQFDGVRQPLWWLAHNQTSYFQVSSTAADFTLTHSSFHAVQMETASRATAARLSQRPDGSDYLGTRPMDYFLDTKAHTVKSMAWVRSIHANTTTDNGLMTPITSGEMRVVTAIDGAVAGVSAWMASGSSWQFLESSASTFTGSNHLYGGLRANTNEDTGMVIMSEFAMVLDEMNLDVGYDASFGSFPQSWTQPLLNGSSTKFLSEVPAFKLPVDNVTSEQAYLLETWLAGRFPLMLRMGVNSLGDTTNPAAPFSVSITGSRMAVSKFEFDSRLRQGVITLEGC
jgi:hypothetical protein